MAERGGEDNGGGERVVIEENWGSIRKDKDREGTSCANALI